MKGNIAIEPPGPLIENVLFASSKGRAWGLTNIPITYDRPLTDPNELAPGAGGLTHQEPAGAGIALCLKVARATG